MPRVVKRRSKRSIKRRVAAALLGVCLLTAVALYLFETRFAAIIRDTAETAVKAKATYLINQTIFAKTAKEQMTYESFVSFEKDNNGQIAALKTNTAEINRFKSALSAEIVHKLAEWEAVGFEIPLGTILGSELAAGKGPMVRVHILPVGTVETTVESSICSAGINQALHRILVSVRAEIVVVTAATRKPCVAETEVCVAETVVVGGIPGVYADIHPKG